jgi:putative membrane protein insertion efficiency factor
MCETDINGGPGKHSGTIEASSKKAEASSYVFSIPPTAIMRLKKLFLKPTEWPSRIAVLLLELYRMSFGISFGGQCRFYPSCSHYAKRALIKHGLIRGSFMTAWRLARCNPFNSGGVDEP